MPEPLLASTGTEAVPTAQAESPSPVPPELSIVIPLYNEEENIQPLYERLTETLRGLGRSYEVLLVNDGSTDGTERIIGQLAEKDERLTAITFCRNFGQTAAMSAGIDAARGEIVIPMDGDLQNDPKDIAALLDTLAQGFDVVSGWRKERRDSFARVFVSHAANAIISWVSGVKLKDYGCSLKAYRRSVLQDVHLYGEMHRFIPIYASWQGARVTEIPVTHHPRTRGKSKYGFERTLKVVLDLIVVKFFASYLTKPVYVFGGFGVFCFVLSLAALGLAVFYKLMPPASGYHKDFVETPLPIFSVGVFIVAVQMIMMGLMAEILVRTYYESQKKRIYVIKQSVHSPQRTQRTQRTAGVDESQSSPSSANSPTGGDARATTASSSVSSGRPLP